jgi:hypothetical protein
VQQRHRSGKGAIGLPQAPNRRLCSPYILSGTEVGLSKSYPEVLLIKQVVVNLHVIQLQCARCHGTNVAATNKPLPRSQLAQGGVSLQG